MWCLCGRLAAESTRAGYSTLGVAGVVTLGLAPMGSCICVQEYGHEVGQRVARVVGLVGPAKGDGALDGGRAGLENGLDGRTLLSPVGFPMLMPRPPQRGG